MCVIRNSKTDSRATSSFNDWRALEYITETLHLCVWFLLLLVVIIYIYTSISIILKRGAKKIIIFLPYLQRYIYIQYIYVHTIEHISNNERVFVQYHDIIYFVADTSVFD